MNRDVFVRNPLEVSIPNDGVAKIGEPKTPQEWDVLKFELTNFVCEGEYKRGLETILSTYLRQLDQPTQPAVWVSGFYGSGKSHLVRVLEYLWRDVVFPNGQTARDIAVLPTEIKDLLAELSTRGAQVGGLWAAAGTLGASAGDSARLAVLGIAFQAYNLPQNYAQGKFVMWLRRNGFEQALRDHLIAAGKPSLEAELPYLYVSPYIARGLIELIPQQASNLAQAGELLRAQFPNPQEIAEEDFLESLQSVMTLNTAYVKPAASRLPCALIVLDELQQYIAESSDRNERVHRVVELCSSQFGSRLLIVATGQSALQGTTQLQKLQGRFTVKVSLSDTDVEKVIREVILRKRPDQESALSKVLEETSGEIDRHLAGTRIAPISADKPVLVADYPLLPSRRRFWERALRAVDRAGSSGQLRTQLRVVYEAVKGVANAPLGTVVAADVIYDQQWQDMIQSGVLLREVNDTIQRLREVAPDGKLCSRLCALIFMISQLPRDAGADIGVRATADTLADLLVDDLRAGSASLRGRIPALLEGMVADGTLQFAEGVYVLQTREGAEWDAAFRVATTKISGDDGRLASDRQKLLRDGIASQLSGLTLLQGDSREPRKLNLSYGSEAPNAEAGGIPIWVRDGWSVPEKEVLSDAQNLGAESPIVTLLIPKGRAEDLKRTMTAQIAAKEVLDTRAMPNTREGEEARSAMISKEQRFRQEVQAMLEDVIDKYSVLQGGGNEIREGNLVNSVKAAANAALSRLYPEFGQADQLNWNKVFDRARDGNGDALSAIGHTGDANTHPVTKRLLSFVSGAGKKGSEIRNQFSAAPFGWSKDAIDGALLVLLAGGFVKAGQNGQNITAKAVERVKIAGLEFRNENAVISAPQRLEIRKLLSNCGVSIKNNDEAGAVGALLEQMVALSGKAGGEPPLPVKPSVAQLEALRTQSGNELLLSVWAARADLERDFASWSDAAAAIQTRLPRWEALKRLLGHARDLPSVQEIAERVAAVQANRSLLSTPDPIPPLAQAVCDALRTAVQLAHSTFEARYDQLLSQLEANPVWQGISPDDRQRLLAQHGIKRAAPINIGTEASLLEGLEAISLAEWSNRLHALPTRFQQAIDAALKQLQPEAVHYRVPSASLKTAEDVQVYIKRLESELLAHVESGHPVIM